MHPLDQALFEAWARVRPKLLRDTDELRARLGRRRLESLAGPPRSMCLAVRSSDRRINWETAALSPYRATRRGLEGPHEVVLDERLIRVVCGPVDAGAVHGDDVRKLAAKLGVTPAVLHHQRKRGRYREESIKGLWGRRGKPVPLVWSESPLDPGSASAFRGPHYAWGTAWHGLTAQFPGDFEQVIERRPDWRTHANGARCFRGWRWICPGCGKSVRTIYYPIRRMRLSEWLGDEKRLLRAAGVDAESDGIGECAGTFACHACHRVQFWTGVGRNGWNQLIGYLTAGLLYGHEVPRPDGIPEERRRVSKPRRTSHPKRDEVERLLREGWAYARIAQEMGVKLSTVQGHVMRLYKRAGVHGRGELIGLGCAKELLATDGARMNTDEV